MGLDQPAAGIFQHFTTLAGIAVASIIAHRIVLIIYRLFFHPLRVYPGPKLWAASNIPWLYHDKIAGDMYKKNQEFLVKYGPEVRIGSDRVLLDGAIAYPEVFMRRPAQPEFTKIPSFYGQKGEGIVSADRENHRRQRRAVSHAFSAQALNEQEHVITQYIDLLITRLRGFASEGKTIDISRWYNFLTFDVIGDMAFGEPFGSLQGSGDYHPWVAMIIGFARAMGITHVMGLYPALAPLIMMCFKKSDLFRQTTEHTLLSAEKAKKRLALGADARIDFMTYIMRNNRGDGKGLSNAEMLLLARTFIAAGSETTSTALTGITYFLTREPEARKRLVDEVRSSFATDEDITMQSTATLPFLNGCIEEGLRLYSPVATIPPRCSPGDFINGKYIPAGVEVWTDALATQTSAKYFADPRRYRPERWLPPTHPLYEAKYANDRKDLFKPFSAGKHYPARRIGMITSSALETHPYYAHSQYPPARFQPKSIAEYNMPSILTTAALVSALYLLSYLFRSILSLLQNLRIAKQIGIPVVWSPVSSFNPLWIVFCKRVVPFLQRLPFGLGDWTRYSTLDWTWIDRTTGKSGSTVHERYGDTFVNVTSRDVEIHTCDHRVSDQILRKYTNDFPKIGHYAKVLDVLGTSLVSSDGDDWTRHRKATVATLSDRTNGMVWSEAIRQTRQMMQHYEGVSQGRILDAIEDIRELYLHVFTRVCYGVAYDFKQPEQIPTGYSLSYKTCLYTSIKGILMLRLIPWSIMRLPGLPLPSRVRTFRQAIIEMQQYLDEMINNCQSSIGGGDDRENQNLLSFMVKRGKESQYRPKTDVWLNESEIRGNLFTYALGGHESSAHTFSFALYLLAAYPETQDWLIQEIDQVVASDANWMSEEAFMGMYSRLPRCQAVILEVLRLYPSVTVVPKCTTSTAATLSIGGSDRRIPPNTNVFVNMPSIQVRESIWGADAGLWNPKRWIAGPDDGQRQHERVRSAPDGAFLAWSEGKRACPGRRFSQVGLVAALAAVLSSHRLEVVPNEGEGPAEARMRANAAVNSTYAIMTVHMYDPYSVKIRMVKREKRSDHERQAAQ
ncbi:hypothetical protein PspLS_11726 [Pyricularia sp. CBS 133598]|nr:hypothetical protein PspLS_11726 [Pyricularia sp. CBS 133598]